MGWIKVKQLGYSFSLSMTCLHQVNLDVQYFWNIIDKTDNIVDKWKMLGYIISKTNEFNLCWVVKIETLIWESNSLRVNSP